jgi:hypothetical protein
MRTILFLLICLFSFFSCQNESEKQNHAYTLEDSILKDLRPYNLPLTVRFPVEDKFVGNYKIQISNELDGFVWYLKKGDNFQFKIEELGDDVQIYDDKISKLTSIDFFSKNIVEKQDNYIVFKLNPGKENESYLIIRKLETNGVCFVISTLERGIKPSLYPAMLKTILSTSPI